MFFACCDGKEWRCEIVRSIYIFSLSSSSSSIYLSITGQKTRVCARVSGSFFSPSLFSVEWRRREYSNKSITKRTNFVIDQYYYFDMLIISFSPSETNHRKHRHEWWERFSCRRRTKKQCSFWTTVWLIGKNRRRRSFFFFFSSSHQLCKSMWKESEREREEQGFKQIVSFEKFISISRSFHPLTELQTQIIQAIVNDKKMLVKENF